MEKLGLVLEGGGMRGVYTAGVLDFFMDKQLYPDGVIGVSAGICHACSYLSKQRGRAFRINISYLKNKQYMGLSSFVRTGNFFGADFIYNKIPNELDLYDYHTYHSTNIPMYAVCTNVETGEAEYISCDNMYHDVQYVRASASLPLLSKIVELDGKKYLDGGVSDSIPVQQFQNMGFTKNIVILTQCESYRKGKNTLLPFIRKVYRKYPKFIKAIENRHIRYNRTLDALSQMQKDGTVFIIQPKHPVEISRLEKDPIKLQALYQQGYEDAKNCYKELLVFIHSTKQ